MSDLPPVELSLPCDTSNRSITAARITGDLFDAIAVVTGQRDACAAKVRANAEWRAAAAARSTKGDK